MLNIKRTAQIASLWVLLCGIAPSVYAVAGVVPIIGEIDRGQVISVRRGIELMDDADTIIFNIDTFGGRVDSALQITTLIGALNDVRTIAYISLTSEGTGVSWSAGALIAMACDEIYMAPGTSIGAAAPVVLSSDGASTAADEKTVSAVRTQMAALAEKNGYPRNVALAMVDIDIELFEANRDGRSMLVTQDEFDLLVEEQAGQSDAIQKGRLVSAKGKLLSLTAAEMEKYEISHGSPATFDELYEALDIEGEVTRYEEPTADQFINFITGSGVTILLLLAGLVALFIEITSPGFGVPGVVAILCFGFVFGSNALIGYVNSVELILLLLGVGLIVVEIFLIPGFGVVGISGIIAIMAALLFAQQDFVLPTLEWQWDSFYRNIFIVLSSVFGAAVLIMIITPFMRSKMFARSPLVLSSEQTLSKGYTVQTADVKESLLGKRGLVHTPLHPAGKVRIDERLVDAVSEGAFIDAHIMVEIIEVTGNQIIVRRV